MAWMQSYLTTSSDFTHLLLNGGKLNVPKQDHLTFLNKYASAVCRDEHLYVVEKKTPIFRLFVDFDFHPVPSQDIIDGALRSFAGLSGLWFDDPSEAVVLRKNNDTPQKVGVHLTFDAIFVTVELARAFREHVVRQLEDACPDVDWNTVVDAAVYGGSGLRMPWSLKRGQQSYYKPVATITQDGTMTDITVDNSASNIRVWVHRTCIRSLEATTTPNRLDVTPSSTPSGGHISTLKLELCQYNLTALKACLPDVYARDETFAFTSLQKFNETCFVLRSNSKKCGNKSYEEHTSSNVYFIVLKKETSGAVIYQKCFSRKDVAYETTCVNYIGPSHHLSQEAHDTFWPPETVQKISSTNTLKALLTKTRCTKTTKKRRKQN